MRLHAFSPLSILLFCGCLLLSRASAGAVPASPGIDLDSPLPPPVTKERIDAGRGAVEASTTLDEAQKQRVLDLYKQAEQTVVKAAESRTELERLRAMIEGAPGRLAAIRKLAGEPDRGLPSISAALDSESLDAVEQAIAEEELALQKARDAQKRFADDLARLLVGNKALSEQIAVKLNALDEIRADMKTPAAEPPGPVQEARALLLLGRESQRKNELEVLQLRLGNHEVLTNLAQAERDAIAQEITARQERLDRLNRAAQQLRETRAARAREEAAEIKSRAESLPPPLRAIAQEHARYLEELDALINMEQGISEQLKVARLRLDEIKAESELTRQQVEFVGPTEAIGNMLKRRRSELPSVKTYRRSSYERATEIARITDRMIEIDELLRARRDTEAIVAGVLEKLSEEETARFEDEVPTVIQDRRAGLNQLQKGYSRYIGQITSLDLTERQLVDVAESYITYIDDQLVWMPDPGFKSLLNPRLLAEGALWLVQPSHWSEVARDTLMAVRSHPVWALVLAAGVALLLGKRSTARERIRKGGEKTRRIRTDSFTLTIKTLVYTFVVIAGWPLLMAGSGLLVGSLPDVSQFTAGIAEGLVRSGVVLAGTLFLIQINLPDNLGERHLRWDAVKRDTLVRQLRWILPPMVPLVFIAAMTGSYEPTLSVHLIGRHAFIAIMLISAVFVFRLLRSSSPLVAMMQRNEGGTLAQTRFLWFPVLVFLPVVFAASSAFGYHDAVVHLGNLVGRTFWFFLALFLGKELLLRFLYVAERRLRFEDALRRREELRAQRAREGAEEEPAASLEIPEIDFAELSEQNRRLIRAGFLLAAIVGIWSIWSDLLPALSFLRETELPLHSTRIVDGISQEVPVTLADLVLGLFIIAIVVLASKNIPGVLEIALLQRLPLDSGGRYAITSLTQYAIAGIGTVAAFSTLGLQWSNIQWLVAALGVGLGFGLQEIVANFISGIILLFERPIRIGDVVTLDNTTGKVSRIQIRATTITNWDKQELLIPNKEFITGRVINWTLTDKVNRVIVTVGVAYGADVQKAMDLMLEAARENPNVLDDPVPVATFEAFGDNALTLLLRSYLGSVEHRLETITALHKAIYAKLGTAGIPIAFPQRDVHLDTDRPLDIRLHRAPRAPGRDGR